MTTDPTEAASWRRKGRVRALVILTVGAGLGGLVWSAVVVDHRAPGKLLFMALVAAMLGLAGLVEPRLILAGMALRRQAPAQPSRYLVGSFVIMGIVLVVSLRLEAGIARRYGLAHPAVTTHDSPGDDIRDESSRAVGAQGEELLASSIAAYRRELAAHPRDRYPGDWANLQSKLGNALREQGNRTYGPAGIPILAEAASALRQALDVYTRDQYPRDWAGAQINLGIVLEKEAARAQGAEAERFIADSAAAYDDALQVFQRQTSPEAWATVELNLAALEFQKAQHATDRAAKIDALGRSIAADRLALEYFTRDKSAADWVNVQNNLGVALMTEATIAQGAEPARLRREAATAYRAALAVATRDDAPVEWAGIRTRLGVVLQDAGLDTPGADGVRLLGEAAASYREVLALYTPSRAPNEWPFVQSSLGETLKEEGKRTKGDAGVKLLAEAADAYRKLVDDPGAKIDAQYRARVEIDLGNTLIAHAMRDPANDRTLLRAAADRFRRVLKIGRDEKLPEFQKLGARGLAEICRGLEDAACLAEAKAAAP